MSGPKVLIIGAGIDGLSLAQILKNKGIPFKIFDRDESETARRQGYAIGINKVADELQAAVRKDMPSIYETNHLLPLTIPAQIVFAESRSPGRQGVSSEEAHPVLRASRHRLRSWLARDIDIRYNKAAIKVEDTGEAVTVYFKDGTAATGDILVGADGTNSAVRKYVTDVEPT